MLYEFRPTTAANTPATAPLLTTLQLVSGVVTQVEIEFPAGCAGLLHVRLLEGLHPLWPSNPDGDIAADNLAVRWPEEHELQRRDATLIAVSWNLDDTFAHTPHIRLAVTAAAVWAQQRQARAALGYLARWYAAAGVVL